MTNLIRRWLFKIFSATPQGKRMVLRLTEYQRIIDVLHTKNLEVESELKSKVHDLQMAAVDLDSVRRDLDSVVDQRNAFQAALAQRHQTLSPLSDNVINWTLHSKSEWVEMTKNWTPQNILESVETIVDSAVRFGVWSPFLGSIHPSEVEVQGPNYRESLFARGFNPRQRAVLDRILDHAAGHDIYNVKIYAHEALTPVARALAGRYPKFIGSEYAITQEVTLELYPIPSIDITKSPLPDATFDFVISNEVLEHVPDLDAALRETARILKPGGAMLGTCPFDPESVETSVRAVLEDGKVRHIAKPEYHGNPVDPEGGSLVFQVPGWDLIDRARKAGFSNPRMLYLSSETRGYTATTAPGVLLFEFFR